MDLNLFGAQGLVMVVLPFLLEWLKKSTWFPWLAKGSVVWLRVWSAAVAALSSYGVMIQSDWTIGHHAIDGLTASVGLEMVGRFVAQLLGQEAIYRRVVKPWLGKE